MKKITILTATALTFLSFTASAQISKGSVYLGGDIGYSDLKADHLSSPQNPQGINGEVRAATFSPVIGIAVKDNLIAGVDLTYQNSKNETYSSSSTVDQKAFGVSAFLRRYFPVASKFYLFGQVSLGYEHQDIEQKTPGYYTYDSKQNVNDVLASIYPGLSYNVVKSFYLEMGFNNLLQIGYEKIKTTNTQTYNNTVNTTTSTQKAFVFQSSLSNSTSLNVGVRFIISKKKK